MKYNLISVTEAAGILGVTQPTIQAYINQKKFQFIRVGTMYQINAGSLIKYLEDNGSSPEELKEFAKYINEYLYNRLSNTHLKYKLVDLSSNDDEASIKDRASINCMQKIRFLFTGMKYSHPVDIPRIYVNELRRELDYLQTIITKEEYITFRAELAEVDPKEVLEKMNQSI